MKLPEISPNDVVLLKEKSQPNFRIGYRLCRKDSNMGIIILEKDFLFLTSVGYHGLVVICYGCHLPS